MDKASQRILLGHITGVSGLKGWIKVHSDTDPRENIFSYSDWWLERGGSWEQVKVVEGRPQGKTIVVQIENINSPEQASQFIGAKIAVDRQAMPDLSTGEYYWADLSGMQVRTCDDVFLGPVSRLFETGANDVMVVTDERAPPEEENAPQTDNKAVKSAAGKEVLVPWLVPDVIKEVDMENRVITVDWDPDF